MTYVRHTQASYTVEDLLSPTKIPNRGLKSLTCKPLGFMRYPLCVLERQKLILTRGQRS